MVGLEVNKRNVNSRGVLPLPIVFESLWILDASAPQFGTPTCARNPQNQLYRASKALKTALILPQEWHAKSLGIREIVIKNRG